jgi:cobalt-zinc-cadmium efflux system outer membrane protein
VQVPFIPRIAMLLVALLIFVPALVDAQGQSPTRPAGAKDDSLLTVQALVATVLATHPRLGATAEAVRAARGSSRTARSWTNPMFSYGVENAGFPGGSAPVGLDREASAMAILPLEPIYQLRSRAAQAKAGVHAAEADLRSERRDVALAAVDAFYEAASAQVSVDAADETRMWLDSLVRYTRTRVNEGAAAEVDLIRIEVEMDRVETDLAISRVDFSRARARLAAFAGTTSFRIDPAAIADSQPGFVALPDLDVMKAVALGHRSDLLAADARVAAARSGVAIERRAILREVGLTTGVKSTAGTRSFIMGFNLPLPLFDQNRGEIQRADAQQKIAAFNRATTEREIVAEVSAAYAAVQTLTAQLARMDGRFLGRAEEARRIAEGAYREGATPLRDVLDAARVLVEARRAYYQIVFARQKSMVDLNAAIGSDFLTSPVGEVR